MNRVEIKYADDHVSELTFSTPTEYQTLQIFKHFELIGYFEVAQNRVLYSLAVFRRLTD